MMKQGTRWILAVAALLLLPVYLSVYQATLWEGYMAPEEIVYKRESGQNQRWLALEDRWIYADVGDCEGLVWHKLIVFRVGRQIATNENQRKQLQGESTLWTSSWGHGDIAKWTIKGPDLVVTEGQPLANDEVGLLVPKSWWCFLRWPARVLGVLKGNGLSPTYSYFSLVRRNREVPRPR